MTKITDIPASLFGTNNKAQANAAPGFDALLNSNDNYYQNGNDLLDSILGSRSGSGNYGIGDTSTFGFSSAFESVFGLTGPLPTFITSITAKLGLSATQNQALQDIAIRNKDITKTPANVQKIAQELKQAGIG